MKNPSFHTASAASKGFTLLELAVAIVIIALLIGSIFAGKSMIRASQIRSLLGQYDATLQAVKDFQDKYHALPGDMIGAQALWGTDTGCPPVANTSTKIPTCDGDGNGHIGDSDVSGSLSHTTEWFRAWQQLADAGFISGAFSGVQASDVQVNLPMPGVNVPAAKLSNASMIVNFLRNTSTGSYLWADQYGHVMGIGAYDATTHYPDGAIMTAAEALDIDSKIDDGIAGTGKIRAWRSGLTSNANCTTDDSINQASQAYNTATGDYSCALLMLLGF